jgi:hypothetical protein
MERNMGFASFDPLAIAMTGIKGMESKRATNTNK